MANGHPAAEPSIGQGRRAQPVLLKEPSSFESLSLVWSDLSARVAKSLPATVAGVGGSNGGGNRWHPGYYPPPHNMPLPTMGSADPVGASYPIQPSPGMYGALPSPHTMGGRSFPGNGSGAPVLFSAFEPWPCEALDVAPVLGRWNKRTQLGEGTTNITGKGATRYAPTGWAPCLCMGYTDGLQIWDVSDMDNIHEVVSIRGSYRYVTSLRYFPLSALRRARLSTEERATLPWVVCVHWNGPETTSTPPTQPPTPWVQQVSVVSLVNEQIIHQWEFPSLVVHEMACNESVLTLMLSDASVRVIDLATWDEVVQFKNVALPDHPGTSASCLALGSRLLAFPTTQAAPIKVKLSPPPLDQGHSPYTRYGVDKMAKEVVQGVRVLGNFGYKTLSNYFSKSSPASVYPAPYSANVYGPPPARPMGHLSTEGNPYGPARKINGGPTDEPHDVSDQNQGTVIVYDLVEVLASVSTDGKGNKEAGSTVPVVTDVAPFAHITCHRHPIAGLTFNANGSLLATVSSQGHAVNVYALLGKRDPQSFTSSFDSQLTGGSGSRHLYRLARGITDASVENILFSADSQWVAVSTGRGTTHVFPINPQGGPVDAPAHLGPMVAVTPLDLAYSFANGGSAWRAESTSVSPAVRIKQKPPSTPTGNPTERGQFYPGYPIEETAGVFSMEMPSEGTPSPLYGYPHGGVMGNVPGPPIPMPRWRPPQARLATCFGTLPTGNRWHTSLQAQYYPSAAFGSQVDVFHYLTPRSRAKHTIQPLMFWTFHPKTSLTLHRLTPGCAVQRTKHVPGTFLTRYNLTMNRDDLAEWQVVRTPQWNPVPWLPIGESFKKGKGASTSTVRKSSKHPKQSPATQDLEVPPTTESSASSWLSQVELVTCPLVNPESLWTSSQFQFQRILRPVIPPPSPHTPGGRRFSYSCTGSTAAWHPPVSNLELKRGAPRPYGTASMDRGDGHNGPYQAYRVQDRLYNAMNSILDIRHPTLPMEVPSSVLGGNEYDDEINVSVSPTSDDFLAVNPPNEQPGVMPLSPLYAEFTPRGVTRRASRDSGSIHNGGGLDVGELGDLSEQESVEEIPSGPLQRSQDDLPEVQGAMIRSIALDLSEHSLMGSWFGKESAGTGSHVGLPSSRIDTGVELAESTSESVARNTDMHQICIQADDQALSESDAKL
ncbi:hypothetical protein IWQ62_002317 [Dispira parvispora]|uniref:BCAS3 WD40 domain-containing protein n=1 Tax=Dispira parvispora TaxID=1520584 RepID=A0A9W8AT09_9FUNG|nr:hypothetical protein IWQ62_002317 [Dispira parvispora]